MPPPGTGGAGSWDEQAAVAYRGDRNAHDLVNAAIQLRRPLLVTGPPGTGKTTLAASIARELALGPVLRWGITSRSTLREGLYDYDVLGRLHDMNLRKNVPPQQRRHRGRRTTGTAEPTRAPGPLGRPDGTRTATGTRTSGSTSGSARWATRCCPGAGPACC